MPRRVLRKALSGFAGRHWIVALAAAKCFTTGLVLVALPVKLDRLGWSDSWLGLLWCANAVSYTVTCTLYSFAVHRVPLRRAMAGSCVLASLASLGLHACESRGLIFVLGPCWSFGSALFWPSLMAWIGESEDEHLAGDISAGTVIAVMLIPQGMAYAMLAGLPPVVGLYASMVPVAVYALFGSSRHLAVGPVAVVSLLIAAQCAAMAKPGSPEYVGITLLLALLVLFTLGSSRVNIAITIGFTSMPSISRVVRSATLSLKTREFVQSARLRGESTFYIIFREILPSVLPVLGVEASVRFSYAILSVASLGFLGLGIQPPSPDWGLMISQSRRFLISAPWVALAPMGAVASLVVGVNLLVDGIRQASTMVQEESEHE